MFHDSNYFLSNFPNTMSRRNTEYIERINGKKWQLYLQWNLHRDEILGNRAISTGFYFIRIFVVASISILFPKEETARLNFQNWDAKDKSVQALVCPFPYFFFFIFSVLFSPPFLPPCPFPPPPLFLDFVSPWIVFLRGRWIFSSQKNNPIGYKASWEFEIKP